LNELQAYEKLLEEKIKQRILANEPNEKIAPLIINQGILDYEIKSRTVLEKKGKKG